MADLRGGNANYEEAFGYLVGKDALKAMTASGEAELRIAHVHALLAVADGLADLTAVLYAKGP